MKETNIALAAQMVNRMFHGGFPEAIVAGGFLRDTLLDLEPKDIDIFIAKHEASKERLVEAVGRAMGGDAKMEFNCSYNNMEVDRIISVSVPGVTFPIQVIELDGRKGPIDRVKEHDFGLCQVWLGAAYGMDCTPAFTHDKAHKTCSLVHCESVAEHTRSIRRWERLRQKLVGFRLVDRTQWASDTCRFCKHHFIFGKPDGALGRVYSEAGKSEVCISGSCETCFDRITLE